MTHTDRIPMQPWTGMKANALAVACLLVGIAGGWLIRGSQSITRSSAASVAATPATGSGSAASGMPNPAQMQAMADAQAAAQIEKLKSEPANPDLLTSIGNVYYDAQQYGVAIDYYGRALKIKPADADVRTDRATAYWYMGNADDAIAEFNHALAYEPNKPNTLFNLGLVKWKGKKDAAGAIADWQKLLAANPNYEGKAQVDQMIAEAKSQGK